MFVCDIVRAVHNNAQHLQWIYQIDSLTAETPFTLGRVREMLARPGWHALIVTETADGRPTIPLGYAIFQGTEGMEGGEVARAIVLHQLVVAPPHRRRRVGRALFLAVAKLLDGRWPRLVARVRLDNQVALAFLKAMNAALADRGDGEFRLVDKVADVVGFTFSKAPVPA